MQKFVETINNLVKLISSLVTLAVLGAVIYGGLRAYHSVAELTSKPIQMPTVKLPAIEVPPIKVAMPEVNLPEISLPGKKELPVYDGFWGLPHGQGPVHDYPIPNTSTRCHHTERCENIMVHCVKKTARQASYEDRACGVGHRVSSPVGAMAGKPPLPPAAHAARAVLMYR